MKNEAWIIAVNPGWRSPRIIGFWYKAAMLIKMLHDLLRLLLIVNGGCILLAFAAAFRHQTLIVWDWMDAPNRAWWGIGNVYSPTLPAQFHERRDQLTMLTIAFVAGLAVQAGLMWLYDLVSQYMPAC